MTFSFRNCYVAEHYIGIVSVKGYWIILWTFQSLFIKPIYINWQKASKTFIKHTWADFQVPYCTWCRKALRNKQKSTWAASFFIHVLNWREWKSVRAVQPVSPLCDLSSPVKSLEYEQSVVLRQSAKLTPFETFMGKFDDGSLKGILSCNKCFLDLPCLLRKEAHCKVYQMPCKIKGNFYRCSLWNTDTVLFWTLLCPDWLKNGPIRV